jgi:hypothetical protein
MKNLFCLLVSVVLFSAVQAQSSDTLYLINGDTIIGSIYAENKYIVKMQVDTGWVFIQHSEIIKPRNVIYRTEADRPTLPIAANSINYNIPAGEFLVIKTNREITTRHAKAGEYFEGRIVQRILSKDGRVIIPEFTRVVGRIKESKRGNMFRKAQLRMELVSIEINGSVLPIRTNENVTIVNNYTAERVLGSAASGSLIGGIFFDEWLEGALYGAAAGAVASLIVENNNIVVPEDSTLQFMLDNPVQL